MSDERSQGVDFGELGDELENHDYPATPDELTEEYGDRTVEYNDGEERFGDVIEGVGVDEFESAEEVFETVMMMVGGEAADEGHSDRGAGTAPDEETDSF
ncbi:hypothetical protein C474_12526 [Halogeometricum pallidum JCM 14848]|uniref:DUF2795 domain-containing protein n=1 Tax=Halogeometricum pallidum JCM 14848 TaxID=1227487 RepID=M0D334_HALPD|nr:hypothetical protein [Halogeometricum pallidum]ELZ29860.1 hypothetical protein C474_12526 [Halogeometricum pallidum JCM 14848]